MARKNKNYKIRWSTEKCKEFIEENNIEVELLSDYVNPHNKMLFRCKCGNTFETNWHSFNDKRFPKRQCNNCGRSKTNEKNKITCEHIVEYLSNNNYTCKLLSTTYVDCDSKLEFECECGNVFYASWSNIKKMSGLCKNCLSLKMSEKFKMSNEDIQKQIDNIYGDGEYALIDRNSSYVTIKHLACGNKFIIKKSHFIDGQGCKFCNKENNDFGALSNGEFLKRVAKYSDEYEFLTKYVNNHTPVEIKHIKCGNVFRQTPSHIYERGVFCSSCNGSKGEQYIEKYLKSNQINFYSQYRFNDCINKKPLPFDFYLPDYNVTIEYQGIQHYQSVDYFGGDKTFDGQLKRDAIKRDYCKKHGIDLIEIHYSNIDDIDNILDEYLSSFREVV